MTQARQDLNKEDYQQLLTLEDIAGLNSVSGFKLYVEDARNYRASLMCSAFNTPTDSDKFHELRGMVKGLNFLMGYVGVAEISAKELLEFEEEHYTNED